MIFEIMFVNFLFTTANQKNLTVITEVLEFEIIQAYLTHFKKKGYILYNESSSCAKNTDSKIYL